MGVKHKEDAPRCGGGKGAASPKTPIGASLKSSAKAMRHFSPLIWNPCERDRRVAGTRALWYNDALDRQAKVDGVHEHRCQSTGVESGMCLALTRPRIRSSVWKTLIT